jgi:hypothetical protein
VAAALVLSACGGSSGELVLPSTPASSAPIDVTGDAPTGPSANTTAFMQRLATGTEDSSILFVGDSTGNESTEWIHLAMVEIAQQHPTLTAIDHIWNADLEEWREARRMQEGTGDATLDIWNFSASGATTAYGLGARYPLLATAPEQIVVSLGKNEGDPTSGAVRGQLLSLTESLAADLPDAAITLVLQPPDRDDDRMGQVRDVYREIADERGYGVIDAYQAFVAAPDLASLFKPDGIHPTTAEDDPARNGSQLWADAAVAALNDDLRRDGRSLQLPSSLLEPGENLALHGDFAAIGLDGVPAEWTADDVTVQPETRADHLAGATGTPVRVTVTGPQRGALGFRIPTAQLADLRGQVVTAAARVWVDDGEPSTAGRIGLADDASFVNSGNYSAARDGWHWRVVTFTVDTDATYVKLRVFADTGDAGVGEVSIDRVIVVAGDLPLAG